MFCTQILKRIFQSVNKISVRKTVFIIILLDQLFYSIITNCLSLKFLIYYQERFLTDDSPSKANEVSTRTTQGTVVPFTACSSKSEIPNNLSIGCNFNLGKFCSFQSQLIHVICASMSSNASVGIPFIEHVTIHFRPTN